jgi:hypothetical protein
MKPAIPISSIAGSAGQPTGRAGNAAGTLADKGRPRRALVGAGGRPRRSPVNSVPVPLCARVAAGRGLRAAPGFPASLSMTVMTVRYFRFFNRHPLTT